MQNVQQLMRYNLHYSGTNQYSLSLELILEALDIAGDKLKGI